MSESIVSAAITRTVRGRNHAECFRKLAAASSVSLRTNPLKLENSSRTLIVAHDALTVQGFITSTGRFVDRVEALQIATNAGQLVGRTKHRPFEWLMSEDLWDGDVMAGDGDAEPDDDEEDRC